MIRDDMEAALIFILNFLVLYVSVTMETVNQGFLENIREDVGINQLDWCGFVLLYLKSSRMMWKRLLFYLHFTKVNDDVAKIPTTGLIHWREERLKDRESEELHKGGLGNVVILSECTDMHHNEQIADFKEDDTIGSERGRTNPDDFKESQHYKENTDLISNMIKQIRTSLSG